MSSNLFETKEGPLNILVDTFISLKRRLLPLLLWLLICLLTAGWYLHTTPSLYTATATIILEPKRTGNISNDSTNTAPPLLLDSAQAESQIQVIRSERLLSSIFDSLDHDSLVEFYPVERSIKDIIFGFMNKSNPEKDHSEVRNSKLSAFNNFSNRVIARRVGQSYVIEISFTSNNPKTARKLTNSIVSGYLLQQVSFKLAAAQNGAEYLQGRVNNLGNQVKSASEGLKAGEVPTAILPDADARIIGSALEPLYRSSPKTSLVLAFSVAFSVLTGLFSVVILNGFDRKIRSASQIERDIGIPCLGEIPLVKSRGMTRRKKSIAMVQHFLNNSRSEFSSAIRDARISLFTTSSKQDYRSIGFVSLSTGVGKTVISTNMASAVAASGSSITLIDANFFDSFGSYSSIIENRNNALADVLNPAVEFRMPAIFEISDRFGFISSAMSSSLGESDFHLGSRKMDQLLRALKSKGDVFIDLPSLESSRESRSIASLIDGIVIVVEYSKTTIDDIRRVKESIDYSSADILGVIINKKPS